MPYLGSSPAVTALTSANIADAAVNSDQIATGAVDLAHMSTQSVDEDNLHISNAGSNGQFLSKQSGDAGGLTWAAAGGGSLILLDTQTASNSSSLDFTTGITSTYSAYLFVLDVILNASAGADMWVRISDDGGSSFEAAGTDYEYVITKREANGNNFVGHGMSQGAAQMLISASQDTSGGHMGGTMWLFSPASTAAFPVFKSDVIYMNTDSPQMLRQDHSIGVYNGATAAVNGIRFLYSAGNIVSGVIRLYGLAIS